MLYITALHKIDNMHTHYYLSKWGHSIDVTFFILYKLCILYTYVLV